MFKSYVFIILFIELLCLQCRKVSGIYEFPKERYELSRRELQILRSESTDQWIKSVNFGVDTVDRKTRFEQNLIASQITIRNGSLSHAQLLDTLPNAQADFDSEIALKILKSSLHAYHTICLDHGISAKHCSYLLSRKELPEQTELARRCKEVLQSKDHRDGHHPFRRLLPRNYKDAFYMMFNEDQLPSPRIVSSKALLPQSTTMPPEPLDDSHRNLALVQWAQFFEHDLSKPVVTSMSNGHAIECCNEDNYKLLPRYRHTACAPLLSKSSSMEHGRETCLNYVRSALAVGESCTFGAPEQLNQASGYFDLSQLYGFTKTAQAAMRTFKNGRIKSTISGKEHQELLPIVSGGDSSKFCAFKKEKDESFCFMAGDSRVNSNPFAIVIYTLFMRNHNRIARRARAKNSNWNDEELFQAAKAINIDTYRRIIFNEWLPEIIGLEITERINTEPLVEDNNKNHRYSDYHISNEFAVVGLRFYFSMMPDVLYNLATTDNKHSEGSNSKIQSNDVLHDLHIFALRDQMYTPNLTYSSAKLDEILQSLLHQRAMKMDSTYVSSLIPDIMGNIRPTNVDILAFDIQRGRDHGLQPYFRYVEECHKTKISSWPDLGKFISEENIQKIRSVYRNWTDIDLIVGAISESPVHGTVGPTLTCILSEQFSKIRKWQHLMDTTNFKDSSWMDLYRFVNASKFLCMNSDLKYVPQNIFKMTLDSNPLMPCNEPIEETLLT